MSGKDKEPRDGKPKITNTSASTSTAIVAKSTMSSTIQNIVDPFTPGTSNWERWFTRFEGWLQIHKITEEQERVLHLTLFLSEKAYNILYDSLGTEKPTDKTFDELKAKCFSAVGFFAPTGLEIAETYKFCHRKQLPGETVQDFASALTKLSTTCNFGTFQNTMLRNHLVFGISSRRTQSRLLETKELTYEKALQIALAMELTEKETNTLCKDTTQDVHYLHANKFQKKKDTVTPKGSKPNTKKFLQNSPKQRGLREKFQFDIEVNGKMINFEVDSGAAVTIMEIHHAKMSFKNLKVHPAKLQLVTYCNTPIQVNGYATVSVKFENEMYTLNLYLTSIKRTPLMGREWIRMFLTRQNASNLFTQNTVSQIRDEIVVNIDKDVFIKNLFAKYSNLTNKKLGKVTGMKGSLTLKPNAKKVFLKARPMPFKLIPRVDKEIENLINEGILVKVETSEFATPVVPVLKADDTVRLCGDYSVTVNPQLQITEHPLPTIDELVSEMSNCTVFGKIDIKWAFLHLEMDEESSQILTINTHKGLYKVMRLMYGIASGPALCEITYCGYIIGKNGLQKDSSKFDAITKMPRPRNVTEVQSFIGMINYYSRFIENTSTLLKPLYELLQRNKEFKWTERQEKSWVAAKKAFTSNKCLAFYDPTLPLVLHTDASHHGVGAVLSHQYPDGTERAIQYISQTLNKTQIKYSMIDKEAYAIVFAIKRLYIYLYGNTFKLVTDHRPLTKIFAKDKGLPLYSAMRMQHYAIFLRGFNFTIEYRKSEQNANADCLSRLPISGEPETNDVVDLYYVNTIGSLLITPTKLRAEFQKDKELQKVANALCNGKTLTHADTWGIDPIEFSLECDILVRNHMIVIPTTLRKEVLQELHSGHFGMTKMKGLAREHCWWPGITRDIETVVKDCVECNTVANAPKVAEKHVWETPTAPFVRWHIDFAHKDNTTFFICVDAFTKWPEVYIVPNMLTEPTIDICKEIFSRFGLPNVVVSDNGPTFTSQLFQQFLRTYGITHKTSAPFHPASNGQAERYVQTIKRALQKMPTGKNLHSSLQTILFQYRTMPHAVTGIPPAELVFNRKIRANLDVMRPNKSEERDDKVNVHKQCREFKANDRVKARNYTGKAKWIFGTIVQRIGKLNYLVHLDDSRIWRRHVNQLQSTGVQNTVEDCDYHAPPDETESSGSAIEGDVTLGPSTSNAESSPSLGSVPTDRTLRPRNKLKAPERLQYHHPKN
ncbi:PREDICTED: uncharacterized protein K02A2.6-like [Trachymyrmex septentrionalis]|uniref:uncharacterized protein K02A2.6-like n=1 Tax=Trachymyrmex septentrionalis TaxID=34720 RepID=UPI00084F210F|nr:PREDICTED: uncharacterized protein K02A2.6-like [Trachymyrmex septentrionalis]